MSDDCACDEAAGKTIVIIHVIGQIRETCDLYVELSFTILGTFVAFSMLFFPRNGWGLCPNLQFLVGEAVLALMDGGKAERGNQRTWRHPHPSAYHLMFLLSLGHPLFLPPAQPKGFSPRSRCWLESPLPQGHFRRT